MTQMIKQNEQMNLSRRELSLQALNLLGINHKNNSPQIMISCPFHSDKTPSMGIDIENGRVHCFSCGYSGSIETFYKDLTGENLYTVLGLNTDRFSFFARENKLKRIIQSKSSTTLKPVYVNYTPEDLIDAVSHRASYNYLINRGISLEIIKSMNMMYAEDTRINTTRFKRRVVIPIYESGRLISFEGRRVFSEDPDPKVLYPKNTSVNTLYDIDNLNKSEPLFACEGLMDLAVLRACSAFKNSTSIFGANLTDRQVELLRQFSEIIYIPDLDEAGQKTVEKLKNSNIKNIKILKLPKIVNGKDIKDIGDLPKANCTVQDLVDRKWFNYIQKL